MSYLLSLVTAKPSFHLNALRASGLDLSALLETPSVSVAWTSDFADSEKDPVQPTEIVAGAPSRLGKLQLRELCLGDE